MAEEISSSPTVSESARNALSQGESEYSSITLQAITEDAPGSGAAHDGVADGITSALGAWDDVLSRDAQALLQIGSTLGDADRALADSILGGSLSAALGERHDRGVLGKPQVM